MQDAAPRQRWPCNVVWSSTPSVTVDVEVVSAALASSYSPGRQLGQAGCILSRRPIWWLVYGICTSKVKEFSTTATLASVCHRENGKAPQQQRLGLLTQDCPWTGSSQC